MAAFRIAEHRPTPCSMRQPVALRWERWSEAFGDLWDMILRCGLLSTGLRQSQRSNLWRCVGKRVLEHSGSLEKNVGAYAMPAGLVD